MKRKVPGPCVKSEISAIARRGLRGGLTPEDTRDFCELVLAYADVEHAILWRLRSVIESAMQDYDGSEDLVEAHALVLVLDNHKEIEPTARALVTG